MTGLGDKAADAAEQFQTAENIALRVPYRIRESELVSATEIGSQEFPRHGDWLVTDAGDDRVVWYLECPAGLAKAIVDELDSRGLDPDDADGYWFMVIDRWQEGDDGPWGFEIEMAPKDVETAPEADEWRDDSL